VVAPSSAINHNRSVICCQHATSAALRLLQRDTGVGPEMCEIWMVVTCCNCFCALHLLYKRKASAERMGLLGLYKRCNGTAPLMQTNAHGQEKASSLSMASRGDSFQSCLVELWITCPGFNIVFKFRSFGKILPPCYTCLLLRAGFHFVTVGKAFHSRGHHREGE